MLRSINVGGGTAARLAQQATKFVDRATDFIDSLDPIP